MKKIPPYIYTVVIAIAFLIFGFFNANDIDEKNKRIRDLEYEVWKLKLDQHTDSVVRAADVTFRTKLDSIFHASK